MNMEEDAQTQKSLRWIKGRVSNTGSSSKRNRRVTSNRLL